jgi:hypothetical protein
MTDPIDQARAAIPSCSLSAAGLERQRARHARLAPDVVAAQRSEAGLEIRFATGYDRDALAELVAVERECCPFFELRIDEDERSLRAWVGDPAHAPALDALAAALGVGSRTC